MADFTAIYRDLRQTMLAAAPGLVIAADAPGSLVLHWPPAPDKPGAPPRWFGTVTIKKSYVAYHLIPLYDDPALGEGLSDALAKRRQGKTCFNFKKADPALFAELAALTQRARAAQG